MASFFPAGWAICWIPVPFSSLGREPNIRNIYRQAVYCYLFGLFDSCLLTLSSVLELFLRSRYESVEGKKSSVDVGLIKLIDWAVSHSKIDLDVAHKLRISEKFVRPSAISMERDCLEAIGQVSSILERLMPSQNLVFNSVCHYCLTTRTLSVLEGQNYLGNKIILECEHCKKNYHWMVMP